ncbi:hypothetical protein BD769DRAFT_1384385 [Suillus cothurnatus]|nr:hypothetical protein BD769DRAFT_1384385 [Suillus cothurnatus]
MSHTEDSLSHIKDRQYHDDDLEQPSSEPLQAQLAFVQARQRRRIAELEEKLVTLESGRAAKESKNDRRYNIEDEETSLEQDRLQAGYVTLMGTLPWFYKKSSDMDYDDYVHMLKMLRQGADSARGDDTSKLKALVSEWVNRELKPDPLIDMDDKHTCGFINDGVRAGIRDCTEGYIVMDLSFPAYLYEKYTTNSDNLEEGLFKGKILLQSYKAVFTSPSSAKDVEGDGDGGDIIENNRCTKKAFSGVKVKKHVAQIIKMEKVTPRSIAYIACQVRFALSSVTSWQSIDGDFNYVQFWKTIVDFFERPPSQDARRRVNKLLEWWTRKVFGRSRRDDLTDDARANLSVNVLTRQRARIDDASFDSD